MTARHSIRAASRSGERDAWTIDSQRAPNVGELLVVAREKKGVTLERAERDTKIRARHLAALENGNAADLPAPVYAKGFLRNYALYLGLDPDEMVMRWRSEQALPRPSQRIAVEPPPQPIVAPRRGLLFTPGVVAAAILTLVVIAFLGYVGLQLVRFSQNPEVVLEGSSIIELAADVRTLELRGGGTPLALVTVRGADQLVRTTTADERGRWSVELPVTRGRNDFTVVARDPETGRETPPLPVIASVAVEASPTPKAPRVTAEPGSSGPPVRSTDPAVAGSDASGSAVLALSEPAVKAIAAEGKVRIVGATDGQAVLVSAQPVGGQVDRSADVPEPVTLDVDEGGAFEGRMRLAEGRWEVTVETLEPGGRLPGVVSRVVVARYEGLVVKISTVDRQARIRVTADGVPGETFLLAPGETSTFRATSEIIIRTGNPRATFVTSNGRVLGAMGTGPGAKTWLLEKGKSPVRVD